MLTSVIIILGNFNKERDYGIISLNKQELSEIYVFVAVDELSQIFTRILEYLISKISD
jgi:hypothetical protein